MNILWGLGRRSGFPYCLYFYLQSSCFEDYFSNCKNIRQAILQFLTKAISSICTKIYTDITLSTWKMIGPGLNGTIRVPIWSNCHWSIFNWILTALIWYILIFLRLVSKYYKFNNVAGNRFNKKKSSFPTNT